jgi:hypothetical protein
VRTVLAVLLCTMSLTACESAGDAYTEPQQEAIKILLEQCEEQGKRLILDQEDGKHECLPPDPAGD